MNFIDRSVGHKGQNSPSDVMVIQQALNAHLQVPYRPLAVNGVVDADTIDAVRRFQGQFMANPDGRVDPFGNTVKRLWPLAYANPTGRPPRTQDLYGKGHHGAPRGSRSHDGTDYQATAGQIVNSPISGRVTRISKPYTSGIDMNVLSGLQIEASDGTTCKIWYLTPTPGIVGKLVKAGDRIGIVATLQNRYPPQRPPLRTVGQMTDHVHVRIHARSGQSLNPATVIR